MGNCLLITIAPGSAGTAGAGKAAVGLLLLYAARELWPAILGEDGGPRRDQ